jgi:hypothetical protein
MTMKPPPPPVLSQRVREVTSVRCDERGHPFDAARMTQRPEEALKVNCIGMECTRSCSRVKNNVVRQRAVFLPSHPVR